MPKPVTRSALAGACIALALASSAAAQQSANPAASDGKPAPTAPGTPRTQGHAGPSLAPSGPPNPAEVRTGDSVPKLPTPAAAPGKPAPPAGG
jgi:hypothetical protein